MSRFHKNAIYHQDGVWAAEQAKKEIDDGLKLLSGIREDIIAFSGSARVTEENPYYQHAKRTAHALTKDGYAILTGGGPGIMRAANTGATEAQGRSIGMKAELLTKEFIADLIYTDVLSFHYFFSRRFLMLIKTNVFIYYPGGLGTLNELLENMMLMQNDIVDIIPMICVGTEYWTGLFQWMREHPAANGYMNDLDLGLVQLLDHEQEVIDVVKRNSV